MNLSLAKIRFQLWVLRNPIYRFCFIHTMAFVVFIQVVFRIFKGAYRRVRDRGDTLGGAITMACDEENRRIEEQYQVLSERNRNLGKRLDELDKKREELK